MSQWTHVCGAIRIDGLMVKHGPAKSLIGAKMHENKPTGSEGPIDLDFTYTGYEEEYGGSLNIGTISVSGDLRDYDDYEEIFRWVEELRVSLKPYMMFRSICILIEVEYKQLWLITQEFNKESEPFLKIEPYKNLD